MILNTDRWPILEPHNVVSRELASIWSILIVLTITQEFSFRYVSSYLTLCIGYGLNFCKSTEAAKTGNVENARESPGVPLKGNSGRLD